MKAGMLRIKTPLAAVVGDPVGHSLSPTLFRSLAKAVNGSILYHRLRLRPEDLRDALATTRKSSPPWIGWNVTLPHKVKVLDYLDNVAATAAKAGAVNVVHFQGGRAIGHNTDGEGFLAPLAERAFDLKGKRVLLLGAGGAARGLGPVLRDAQVAGLTVLGRTKRRVEALAAELGARAGALEPGPVLEAAASADLVINATPLGMDGKSTPLPAGTRFKSGALAYDLVYTPADTPFLKAARRAKIGTLGGLAMLVAQAAAAWRIWFAEELPAAVTTAAGKELARRLA